MSVEEGGAPHSPLLKRQSTLGVSELKKRKAEQAKKRLAPAPPLISRDQVLTSLFKILAEAETEAAGAPTVAGSGGEAVVAAMCGGGAASASASGMMAPPLVPVPPQTAREAHHSREHLRNGGSRPPSANGPLANGGSRPASARGAVTSRPASSSPTINFLSKILSNKEGNGQKDVLPATVPTWKEDLVDNVRRRAAANQAVKDYEAKCAAEKLAAEALEKEKQEMARLEAMTTADSLAAAGKATSRVASARGQREAESWTLSRRRPSPRRRRPATAARAAGPPPRAAMPRARQRPQWPWTRRRTRWASRTT